MTVESPDDMPTKSEIDTLRRVPLDTVARAISYTGSISDDNGKPIWKNAIDMVKTINECDYSAAVKTLHKKIDLSATDLVPKPIVKPKTKAEPKPLIEKPQLTRQEYAITKELQKQLSALSADKYRITVMHEHEPTYNVGKGKGVDGAERFYSADELVDMVPRLNRENWAKKYNIFVTPLSDDNYYVLLDDLTDDTLKQIKVAGYKPNLVQYSSHKSIQAVFILPKSTADKIVINEAFKTLNRTYGDPKIVGLTHPFRVLGFRNMKAKHVDSSGMSPTVSLISTSTGVCQKLMSDCQKIEQDIASTMSTKVVAKAAPTEAVDRVYDIPNIPIADNVTADALEFYRFCVQSYPNTDLSRADWMLISRMRNDGIDQSTIKSTILKCSPNISQRHSDVHTYVSRTIANHYATVPNRDAKTQESESIIKMLNESPTKFRTLSPAEREKVVEGVKFYTDAYPNDLAGRRAADSLAREQARMAATSRPDRTPEPRHLAASTGMRM